MVHHDSTIRWLHLSDLHFRVTEQWERQRTLAALLRSLKEEQDQGWRPDLLFLTGDIGYSGRAEEYDRAEEFLRKLIEQLELDLPRVCMVPGNHDVNRLAIGPTDGYILDGVRGAGANLQEALTKVFNHADTLRMLGKRLEAFYAFTERLLGPARALRPEQPWRTDAVSIDGVLVGILQLNSAWAGGTDEDKARLLLGELQVERALQETADCRLRFALLHHPLSDLVEQDQERVAGRLQAPDGAHFLLRGHRHQCSALAMQSPDGLLTELAAGTVYVEDRWPKGFLLGQADLVNGQGQVDFFCYSDYGRGFWRRDPLAYEKAPQGIFAFDLSQELHLGKSHEKQPGEITAETNDLQSQTVALSRREALLARYQAAVAAVYGTVRFVGLASRRERPNIQAPVLFVPLRLQRIESRSEDEPPVTTREIVERLLSSPEQDHHNPVRWAILGDPGSGKTTLCRYLLVVLAGQVDTLPIAKPIWPLFIPFRYYVHQLKTNPGLSLLDFVCLEARTRLSIEFPDGMLPQLLEEGNAVVIVDGLDEVGDSAEREEMRNRLQGFCANYPRVSMILTSRIAGYDQAPLPKLDRDPRRGFEHLQLAPFDDQEIREFVTRWYTVQEPEDAKLRSDRIIDLLSSLRADPRIMQLASNPLFATLIALVHRYEAHLPGDRAELFERCVQTMLQDWPASKKHCFAEIDEKLQRQYLERLALIMQKRRTQNNKGNNQKEVVIDRAALLDNLLILFSERLIPDQAKAHGVAKRWLDYLEHCTGLLVEQRPGVFGFVHLAFMEYLAACGLEGEAQSPEKLVAEVVEKYQDAAWLEVCLLTVGRHAADGTWVDLLFEKLMATKADGKDNSDLAFFLLRCLREEAAFRAEHQQQILELAAQRNGVAWSEFQLGRITFTQIVRFSRRNGLSMAAQWEAMITRGVRDELIGAILLDSEDNPAHTKALTILSQRKDHEDIIPALLQLWPGHPVGNWAAENASLTASIQWLKHYFAEDAVSIRSIAALLPSISLNLRLIQSLALSRRALNQSSMASYARDLLAPQKRSQGQGLPGQVRFDLTSSYLMTSPRSPLLSLETSSWYVQFPFSRQFFSDFGHQFLLSLNSAFSHLLGCHSSSRPLQMAFIHAFSISYSFHLLPLFDFAFLEHNFSQFFEPAFIQACKRIFIQAFSMISSYNYGNRLDRDLSSDFGPFNALSWNISPPSNAPTKKIRKFWSGLKKSTKPPTKYPGYQLLAEQFTEAWIALVTTVKQPENIRFAYLNHRLQARWLLYIWPIIDEWAQDVSDPSTLALYLALGWTQATITWQWPDSDKWYQIFQQGPPEHWLPRAHYGICWLVYDPKQKEHRQALHQALQQGLEDAELKPVAEAMLEMFPEPTSSDVTKD